MMSSDRRDFLKQSAAMFALGAGSTVTAGTGTGHPTPSGEDFTAYQRRRRADLWALLGELPWDYRPAPPRLIKTEKRDGYTVERLILDLNGFEPVPALLLLPDRRPARAPGLLYIHWHGGMYDLGKEQLLIGVKVAPAYAPDCAEKGIVTLAIDSWCFGERKKTEPGRVGE